MDYNVLKALHIIFVVTWFAGLFYIVRLFVYQTEAQNKSEEVKKILIPQYQLMSYRLWYIITWPSAILASIFGFWMIFFTPMGQAWLQAGWMYIKLLFVLFLFIYHGYCHYIYIQLQQNIAKWSSTFFRIWNEVATIILIAIVFLVVLKNSFDWIYGVVGIIGASVLLMIGIKLYKRIREKNQS